MEPLIVGVLALQGAFAKHMQMLQALDVTALEVRTPQDLNRCGGLIIPGGESTTIMRQMKFIELPEEFRLFAKQKPVFGTCAGLILMSQEILGDAMQPFQLLDISVERNAFGRQVESFNTDIDVHLPHAKSHPYEAVFIRSPRIRRVGHEVKVLASHGGEAVLVQQGKHLGASFHPELTRDPAIHAYFIKLVRANAA